MTLIKSIAVQNVRAHASYRLTILPSTTVITGPNGSGKTSLLEALYIALQGSSFKGGDMDVLQLGSPWYRIDVAFNDNTSRSVKFEPARQSGKKQFIINNATQYRLTSKHKYPVVLFEPNDLRLLNGSPSRRREYIDRFIAQIDPVYYQALKKYERALKQRNNLLKQPSVSPDELFVWDVTLSEYGAYIIERRIHFIGIINEKMTPMYTKIANSRDNVAVVYSHSPTTKQKLVAELHAHVGKDTALGYTGVGPHRHDVLFSYNNSPALAVASRGEVRSIMLALKFIEVAITENTLSQKPIILLDDVFSELDSTRRTHLVENFKDYQVLITSAEAGEVSNEHVVKL